MPGDYAGGGIEGGGLVGTCNVTAGVRVMECFVDGVRHFTRRGGHHVTMSHNKDD